MRRICRYVEMNIRSVQFSCYIYGQFNGRIIFPHDYLHSTYRAGQLAVFLYLMCKTDSRKSELAYVF